MESEGAFNWFNRGPIARYILRFGRKYFPA